MLNNIFISDAMAQAAQTAPQEVGFASFMPLIIIFAIFYLLIIRPQSKKYKEQQAMVNSLKIGNKVITNSGIIGVVKEISNKDDNLVDLEISDGVQIKIVKQYISGLADDKDKKDSLKSSKKAKK